MDQRGQQRVRWAKLSCRRFKDNVARLHLLAMAYNLSNFLRHLVLHKPIGARTLTTLREKPINVGAKVEVHAKHITFRLAEVTFPRALFAALSRRSGRPRPACASG